MHYPKFCGAEFDNVILKVGYGATSRFLLARFVPFTRGATVITIWLYQTTHCDPTYLNITDLFSHSLLCVATYFGVCSYSVSKWIG